MGQRRIDSHAFCAVVSLVGFKETTPCDAFKESTKLQLGFKERARCGFFETKREAKEIGCLAWFQRNHTMGDIVEVVSNTIKKVWFR